MATAAQVVPMGAPRNVGGAAPDTADVSAKTATYAVAAGDDVVVFNGVTLTATLPTAIGAKGRTVRLKNVNASPLTVATTAAQTIDGAAPAPLAQWARLTVVSDGANWLVL